MHDSENELYKVAFVIILCFGIMSALIVPIVDVNDELEHLTRAEITSQGEIFPHWEGGKNNLTRLYNHTSEGKYSTALNTDVGFNTSESHMFFLNNRENTVFDTPNDTDKISKSTILDGSAFEQNPFYGYIPQAIGMVIAKLLDLNVIWMLWLGRIFNLIFYAGLISLAIKKAPVLKMPLLAVSCIPISIYQAASLSIDSMIIGLAILAVAYFLYLYKAEKNSLGVREVVIFSALCLILGLCKLPYLAFIFLLLLIPFDNFKKGKKNHPLYDSMHSPCWNNRSNVEQIFRTCIDAFLEVQTQIPRSDRAEKIYSLTSMVYWRFYCSDIYTQSIQDSIRYIQFLRSGSKDTLFRQLSYDSSHIIAVWL